MDGYTHIIKVKNIPEAWFKAIYDIFNDEDALADVWKIEKGSYAGQLRREFKSILIEIENPCDPDLIDRIPMIPEGKCIPNPIDPVIYPEVLCPTCGEPIQSFKMLFHKFLAIPCNHEVEGKFYEMYRPTCDQTVIKYFGNYFFSDVLAKHEQYTYGSRIMELVEVPSIIKDEEDKMVKNPIYNDLDKNFSKYFVGAANNKGSYIKALYPQYYYLCSYLRTNPGSNQIIMQIAKPSDVTLPDPPCVTEDAYIITDKGVKNANEIKVGDKILSHKGRFREVKKIYRRMYQDHMYRMERTGGLGVDITKLHPILGLKVDKCYDDRLTCKENCKKRISCYEKHGSSCKSSFNSYNQEWIDSDKCGNNIYVPIGHESIEEQINLKNRFTLKTMSILKKMFRLFGYYIGDGSLLKPDTKEEGLKISLNKDERFKIEEVKDLFRDVFNKETSEITEDNCTGVFCYSQKLCRVFKKLFYDIPEDYELGKGGGKWTCIYKVFPVKYLFYSREIQQELIAGLMHSDGYSRDKVKRKYCEIYVTSKKLSILLSTMFSNIYPKYTGTVCDTTKHKSSFIDGREIISKHKGFIFRFGGDNVEYGKERYLNHDKNLYRPLELNKSRVVNNITVYNFEVEEDNSYLVNGWLPAHNCLRHIDMQVKDGKLNWFIYFRSWDLWGGLPLNLVGLSMLMDQMCVETGLEPGRFECHSKGLHLYEHTWSTALARLGRSSKDGC